MSGELDPSDKSKGIGADLRWSETRCSWVLFMQANGPQQRLWGPFSTRIPVLGADHSDSFVQCVWLALPIN